jgi:DNA-binding NarL/FixJ family response regulator
MNKLKVLLADDHDCFRRILIAFLKAQHNIEVVGEAVNGEEAIEQAEKFQPDIILMDVHMPKQNGIEATKAIKHRWPGTKVFILSMDPSEFYRKNTQLFADGFIAKTSMKNALLSVLSDEHRLQMNTTATAAFAA